MLIDSGVRPDNVEAAQEAILAEVEAMKRGEFTDEEIRFALLSLQNTFRSVEESLFSVESYYRAQKVFGIRETPEEQCEKLAKVTREEIVAAANLLQLDTIYLLNGTAEGDPGEEDAQDE
jgi:predicted Zn-dependent peptidase